MPQKSRFSRQELIDAAMRVVQRSGLRELSARKVAEELGSSTAPVYSYFGSMSELEKEVMNRAKDMLLEYTRKPYTDRFFLNMGTGVVLFARDHCELFRALFMERSDFKSIVGQILDSLRDELVHDTRFDEMSKEEKDHLIHKMWILTHGLASLICVGLISRKSESFITDTLNDVGGAVVAAAMADGSDGALGSSRD
jgi:AcrR family transcriptional regulator